MEIMNICVLHLSDIERDTGSGVDREELIQWYLEQKETEFETEEDLEYERELIAKALTKLSRVSLIRTLHFLSISLLMSRIIIYLKSEETSIHPSTLPTLKTKPWTMRQQQMAIKFITSFIPKLIYPTFLPPYLVFSYYLCATDLAICISVYPELFYLLLGRKY